MGNERILTRDEFVHILDKMWGEYAWKHEINWLNSTDGYLRRQIADHNAVLAEKDKEIERLRSENEKLLLHLSEAQIVMIREEKAKDELMAQAVRFAEWINRRADPDDVVYTEAFSLLQNDI